MALRVQELSMRQVEAAALGFVVRLEESIFVVVECCRVGDVFFPSVEYLDPNFGVTHVGIVYCIISSDILIRIQILLTESAGWN